VFFRNVSNLDLHTFVDQHRVENRFAKSWEAGQPQFDADVRTSGTPVHTEAALSHACGQPASNRQTASFKDSLLEVPANVDALRIVHTCPRLQAVSGPSGSSQSSNARAPSLSSRARRSNLHFKNASKESLQSFVDQNCVQSFFADFWEVEVDDARRSQDIQYLAWVDWPTFGLA